MPPLSPPIRRPSPLSWGRVWAIALLGALAVSLHLAGVGSGEPIVNSGGWGQVAQFFRAARSPDLSPEFLQLTAVASLKTLAFGGCGTATSVALGLVGGLLGSEVWWRAVRPGGGGAPWTVARSLLAVPRSIHEAIWGLLFANLFGLDPLVAIAAIAIPFGAIVSKVFSEILDETPQASFEALLNAGVPPLSAFLYGLLPQASLNLLSYGFYRFECSIRSAAVLGLIGAGGLGYEILLSLQSLRYEQLWTLLGALVVLTGLTDAWSAALRHALGAPSRLELKAPRKPSASPRSGLRAPDRNDWPNPPRARSPRQSPFVLGSAIAAAAGTVAAFAFVGADYRKLWAAETGENLRRLAADLFPPDFGSLAELASLSLDTLAMSVLAGTLAAVGGMVLAFPAARNFLLPGGIFDPQASPPPSRANFRGHSRENSPENSRAPSPASSPANSPANAPAPLPANGTERRSAGPVAKHPHLGIASLRGRIALVAVRGLLLVARAIPEPVWALLCLFVLFPGILPGAIALGLHNLGILGRLMAEGVENLDPAPLRALAALGADRPKTFLYGVLPRVFPQFLAYALYRWEVCTRSTVIVGLVGAGGLGRLLQEQSSSFDYGGMTATLLAFLALTFLADGVSATVRRTLR